MAFFSRALKQTGCGNVKETAREAASMNWISISTPNAVVASIERVHLAARVQSRSWSCRWDFY